MSVSLMIIDNDQVNSFVLKKIILRNYSDADISIYLNAPDALDALEGMDQHGSSFPDVILLDIYMPILSGYDFLDAYTRKYSHKHTIIFAMSSSISKDDQQRANNYKVVKGYITKPLIYNNIQFVIESVPNSSRDAS